MLLSLSVSLAVAQGEDPTATPAESPTAAPTPEVTEALTATVTLTETVTITPTVTLTPTTVVTVTPVTTMTPTTVVTATPGGEPTAEPTEAATEVPTAAPTEEVTEEPTAAPTEEPPAARDESASGGVGATGGEVGVASALPGNFTTEIIAIANLETSGTAEAPVVTLYDIDSTGTSTVSGVPSVYPGGVGFVTDSQFSTGRYAAVIQSSFQAAAVALTTNSTAKTADAYAGFNSPATTLYGTLIFNKHSNWESILYCQNAGSGTATIYASLYKTGQSAPKVTLSSSVGENETVIWDIADNSTVQSAWPGGTGEYGYAVFTSTNTIACVIDNQRMASPYVQSQFNAVPASYAGTDLRVPLVFNGHGSSSSNSRAYKWNTGISLVNISSSTANVQVTYTSGSYTNTCTKSISANGSDVWYAPEVGTGPDGWSCSKGALSWSYPGGPTYGSVQITSNVNILAIANSNRYDSAVSLGAGYSSLAAAPSNGTSKAVCPLAFNKDPGTDWITGIQAANVGSVTTNITFKMVKANANPSGSGNSVTITKTNIAPGSSATAYFPEESSALSNFEGAVFVEATASGAAIAVSSSNTNYNTMGAAALYDCINY